MPIPTDTRSRVLRWRLRGWPVWRIAEKLEIRPQSVYYHLHILEAEGAIEDPVRRYRKRRAS